MRIYIMGDGGARRFHYANVLLTLAPTNDGPLTKYEKDRLREGLRGDVFATFGDQASVRFEDECPECGAPYQNGVCDNPRCKNGSPPGDELRRLIGAHAPFVGESAVAYLERITGFWKEGVK